MYINRVPFRFSFPVLFPCSEIKLRIGGRLEINQIKGAYQEPIIYETLKYAGDKSIGIISTHRPWMITQT